ncbi:hypothetical protein ACS0TY_026674 [Phlomoides rotata]
MPGSLAAPAVHRLFVFAFEPVSNLVAEFLSLFLFICLCESLSTYECENLCFTGLALCSYCHSFAEYINDQELVSDCLMCCAEDSVDATNMVLYSNAFLEDSISVVGIRLHFSTYVDFSDMDLRLMVQNYNCYCGFALGLYCIAFLLVFSSLFWASVRISVD